MAVPGGGLVPVAGPDGTIQWQQWTWGELVQQLNNELILDTAAINDATAALLKAPAWAAPILLNAWANQGGAFETVGYLKDPLGFVHIKGVITGGASNTVVFTLPPGYRPGASTLNGASDGNALGAVAYVQIATNGNVLVVYSAGGGAFIGMSGITFLAEN